MQATQLSARGQTSKRLDLRQLMPSAQQVRLRASCLRWLPRESRRYRTSRELTRPSFLQSETNGTSSEGTKNQSPEDLNQTKGGTRVEEAKKPSLLEELFPEEAKPKSQGPSRPKERDIPRLDIRSSLPKPATQKPEQREPRKKPESDNWWNRATETAAEPSPVRGGKRRSHGVGGVLMLRNASKTLVEDDFTRLIPQGLHIEGWALDQADIVKVVPGRNTSTLERANFYFILFSTRAAMNAYRTHVLKLHSLAARHVQSSLISPIPPPPGYHLNGHDVDALLQSYTLVPPSRMMRLLPLPMSVSPSIVDIIQNLGYPDVVKGPLRKPYVVMIRLEGPQLPITMIKGVLSRVERERRIPWNRDFGDLSYHTWEPKPKNISPLDERTRLDKNGDDEGNSNEIEEIAEMDRDAKGGEEGSDRPGRRERRKPRCSYLFGFDSEDAALTFVQYWHRRPLDMAEVNYANDEIAPVVDAELLW
ncbi:hypothetical protein D6D05_04272 [Aureobasidium pullulans]|nr:hypothetical protein D6D05_04272 [Aureobasidium pullulans]